MQSIKNAGDWREIAAYLLDHYRTTDQCFSAGQIADFIRQHRPDLDFRVRDVSDYLRSAYEDLSITYEDGLGELQPAVRMARSTAGTGRTPAGVAVMVYGPNYDDVINFIFEVDIPPPQAAKVGYPTETEEDDPDAWDGDEDDTDTDEENDEETPDDEATLCDVVPAVGDYVELLEDTQQAPKGYRGLLSEVDATDRLFPYCVGGAGWVSRVRVIKTRAELGNQSFASQRKT